MSRFQRLSRRERKDWLMTHFNPKPRKVPVKRYEDAPYELLLGSRVAHLASREAGEEGLTLCGRSMDDMLNRERHGEKVCAKCNARANHIDEVTP